MPRRIEGLPVHRGYPVPWFVAWLNDDGVGVDRGTGTPDFRVLAPGAIQEAHRFELCWICGVKRGSHKAFVVGPMCAVNRVSAEPPSHVECAEWSTRGCPFLTRPDMRRRESGLPADAVEGPGMMLLRNPGVALVWITRDYRVRPVEGGGYLFAMGDPERVLWVAEGRPATYAEVKASIDSGLPLLMDAAQQQGSIAVDRLMRQLDVAMELVPGLMPS